MKKDCYLGIKEDIYGAYDIQFLFNGEIKDIYCQSFEQLANTALIDLDGLTPNCFNDVDNKYKECMSCIDKSLKLNQDEFINEFKEK